MLPGDLPTTGFCYDILAYPAHHQRYVKFGCCDVFHQRARERAIALIAIKGNIAGLGGIGDQSAYS